MKPASLKAVLRRFLTNPLFWLILCLFFFGLFIDSAASFITMQRELPVLQDVLLDHLPLLPVFWVYDVVSLLLILLLVSRLLRDNLEDVPYVLLILGALQLIRALLIFLNPLAPPPNSPYGLLERISAVPDAHQGSIPSGHVMWGVFIALYLRGRERAIATALVVVLLFSLIFSRAHYTIDLVVGALLGFTLFVVGGWFLRPWLAARRLARSQKRF